ncbi:MAG: hypothetical protein ACKV0T_04410 [Planctomycetales bacterium]
MHRCWRGSCAAALALVLCAPNGQAEDAPALLRHIPESANALVVVRFSQMLDSPLAQRERWQANQREKFLAIVGDMPAWVDLLVLGAQVHPADSSAAWRVALVPHPSSVVIDSIAARERGVVESLAEHKAVLSTRGIYYVELEEGLLGLRTPPYRQDVARWVRKSGSPSAAGVSPFLRKSGGDAGQLVLALDMADMVDARRVAPYLDRIRLGPQAASQVQRALGRLLGLKVSVRIEERIELTITLDFSVQPGNVGEALKQLFLQALNDQGLGLPELDGLKVKSAGLGIRFEGAILSEDSLRRLLTFALAPPGETPTESETPENDAPATEPDKKLTLKVDVNKTKRYLRSVNQIVADLERSRRQVKDYERTAAWHDNYAEKIDKLPTGGVDGELVEYGGEVSSWLRALAASLRGVAVEVNTQQRSVTYNTTYDPGWGSVNIFGGVGYKAPSTNVQTNLQQVRERQADAIQRGAKQREDIWLLMLDAKSRITDQMQARHGIRT